MTSPVVEYASPATSKPPPRLLSLDVFRGLVILAMLVVNNIGDNGTTGYFWRHSNWQAMSWAQAWQAWGHHAINIPASFKHVDPLRSSSLVMLTPAIGQQIAENAEEVRMSQSPWCRIPLFTHCSL